MNGLLVVLLFVGVIVVTLLAIPWIVLLVERYTDWVWRKR